MTSCLDRFTTLALLKDGIGNLRSNGLSDRANLVDLQQQAVAGIAGNGRLDPA